MTRRLISVSNSDIEFVTEGDKNLVKFKMTHKYDDGTTETFDVSEDLNDGDLTPDTLDREED